MVANESAVVCGLCGASAVLAYLHHPGFLGESTFDIFQCASCDTAQALPREVDAGVYEYIYRHAASIPGYDRYSRYASAVVSQQNPIGFLAEAEDTYWAIRQVIEGRRAPHQTRVRVLEVGSGLGYLTYALRQAGYDAVGIDVSETAVLSAQERFGPWFAVQDVAQCALDRQGDYDFVVMTEVIEHIPDAGAFLRDSLRLLAPTGQLVLTTPNKSGYASSAIWMTDNPPVHLWWFSEASMRYLAEQLACDVSFVDFSEFNAARVLSDGAFLEGLPQRSVPFCPIAGQSRRSLTSSTGIWNSTRQFLAALGLLDWFRRARIKVSIRQHGISTRRPCLCAVLVPQ